MAVGEDDLTRFLVQFRWFNGERHLFLGHQTGCFSLDVKTFQLETVLACVSEYSLHWLHAYSNFPPSLLSFPTIPSGNFIAHPRYLLPLLV
jgi:hypothetical protein